MMSRILACVCVLCPALPLRAEPVEWARSGHGLWEEPSNWGGGMVPGFLDDVRIAIPGFYSVLYTGDHSVLGIELLNQNGSLDLLAGSFLSVSGDVVNDGLIELNPKLGVDSPMMELNGEITFSGSGELRLNASEVGETLIRARINPYFMLNGFGHTLSGGGEITADFVNSGFVTADHPLAPLQFTDADITNNASMIVDAGGQLFLDGSVLNQSAGSYLGVLGPGAEFRVIGRVIGGFVDTSLGGVVRGSSGRFVGVQVGTDFDVVLDDVLELEGCVLDRRHLSLDGPGTLSLLEGTSLVGPGSVHLRSSSGVNTHISISRDSDILSDYTIRGAGSVRSSGRFVNRSRIDADEDGRLLELNLGGDGFHNESELRAVNGGTLWVHGYAGQAADASIVSIGPSSVVDLSGATIVGGRVESVQGGRFVCDSDDLSLSGVVMDADVVVNGAISISGEITNLRAMTGRLASLDGMVLEGFGSIHIPGGDVDLGTASQTSGIVNGPFHRLTGYGDVHSPLVNAGRISANVAGETLRIDSAVVPNSGTMEAVDGGVLELDTSVQQTIGAQILATGTGSEVVLYAPGGTVREISGGSVRASGGGLVRLADRLIFRDIHLSGHMLVDDFGFLEIGDGCVIDGLIQVDPKEVEFFGGGVLNRTDEEIGGDGVIQLTRDDRFSFLAHTPEHPVARFGPGIRIEGLGEIRLEMLTRGTLAPGLPVGQFSITMPIEMLSDAVLEIEFRDVDHDRLVSSSSFVLGGTLDLRFLDGFAPDGYWARTVIEAGTIDGGFDQIVAPAAPAGLVTRVYSTGTELAVGQTCLADINLDGEVNFFDVSEFVRLYQDGGLGVDLNGDGMLSFFDVTAFIVGYQAGCP